MYRTIQARLRSNKKSMRRKSWEWVFFLISLSAKLQAVATPTRPNSSPFAKNTELVNPPESVYRICNLCSDYSTKCGGIFGTNLLQKTPPSANAEFFLSSANAEFWGGAKKEKKIVSSWARTRFLKLARHRSTHYSTPPFIPIEVFYRLYIQKQYFFSS